MTSEEHQELMRLAKIALKEAGMDNMFTDDLIRKILKEELENPSDLEALRKKVSLQRQENIKRAVQKTIEKKLNRENWN